MRERCKRICNLVAKAITDPRVALVLPQEARGALADAAAELAAQSDRIDRLEAWAAEQGFSVEKGQNDGKG